MRDAKVQMDIGLYGDPLLNRLKAKAAGSPPSNTTQTITSDPDSEEDHTDYYECTDSSEVWFKVPDEDYCSGVDPLDKYGCNEGFSPAPWEEGYEGWRASRALCGLP